MFNGEPFYLKFGISVLFYIQIVALYIYIYTHIYFSKTFSTTLNAGYHNSNFLFLFFNKETRMRPLLTTTNICVECTDNLNRNNFNEDSAANDISNTSIRSECDENND